MREDVVWPSGTRLHYSWVSRAGSKGDDVPGMPLEAKRSLGGAAAFGITSIATGEGASPRRASTSRRASAPAAAPADQEHDRQRRDDLPYRRPRVPNPSDRDEVAALR